jgi:LuxR family transcriptional regulator, maltose regulon positive regulatory protein
VAPAQDQTHVPGILLGTKLYVPRAARRSVARARLTAALDRGADARLVLMSAPPGFGKTTLLGEWLAAGDRQAAWLSLDEGDNHPATFWTYLVAALQTVAPQSGSRAMALLRASPPAPITTVLTTLINDLGELTADVVLVLDDYHVIETAQIHEAITFLLDHGPRQLHVMLACRADPPLPVARLRARGELVEIRAADLRFTPEEARAYLNDVMDLHLRPADVAALDGRTEGWIAALQLAALSLQGRDDVAGFIAGFSGEARFVVDYLIEEVLVRQPEPVQRFLLSTCVLERLSGPLCDAVTGEAGGRAMLEKLDRANLFVVPLDDRRCWYRFHHLFAEVLRARLVDEDPERLPLLHRRASDWYEANGEPSVAITHALAAKDFQRAADLVELAAPSTRRHRQEHLLRGWLEAFPDEFLRESAVLSNALAGTLMATGQSDGVEARLQDAERGLALMPADAAQEVRTGVCVHRAGLALMLGDLEAAITHARRALGVAAADDFLGRAAAGALIGLASWYRGELGAAHAGYAESMTSMVRAGHLADVLGLAIAMADIEIVQGQPQQAMATYQRALRLAPEGAPVLRGTADMYVGMAALQVEFGDLTAAAELLQRSHDLGEQFALPQNAYRWRAVMARIKEAAGELDAAVHLLGEAEEVYVGDFSPNVRPIPALRARVYLAQGRMDDALRWARERGLTSHDDLAYLSEFEHITLAMVLLAQHRTDPSGGFAEQALALLDRLLQAAQDGGRGGSVREILVVRAAADQMLGDTDTEPVGVVGLLSGRELDVLRLLGSDLSGPAIARELSVSLNTVRTHTKNIYAKLGVNDRRAAVRAARERALLNAQPSTGRRRLPG